MSPIPAPTPSTDGLNYPLVQLVAKPVVGATVLYDFNVSHQAATGHEGFTLGAPEWSGQPGMVGGKAGYRTASFTHYVEASEPEYAIELATLSRLLTASDGWLLVQLSQWSQPRWLRTWRSNASELSWEGVHLRAADEPRGLFEIPISLTCDPWLRGERITHALGAISLDPAMGCFKRLPPIEGDAPAPVSSRIVWAVSGRHARRDMFVYSPVPEGQTSAMVWGIGVEDAWTRGTDTGVPVADFRFSNGSYRPVTFATQTGMDTRLSGKLNNIRPGRYKVMLRVGRSDTNSLFAFRLGAGIELGTQWGDRVPVSWQATPTTHIAWVDLGDFWLPAGVPPIDLADETLVSPEVVLQVQRTLGAGQAWLDALMLIPAEAETRTLLRDCATLGIPAAFYAEIHDAEAEAVYTRKASGDALGSSIPPGVLGGFGRVYPGKANALHILGQSHPLWSNWLGVPSPDDIAEVATVTVDYAPRWMWPDPAGA